MKKIVGAVLMTWPFIFLLVTVTVYVWPVWIFIGIGALAMLGMHLLDPEGKSGGIGWR